MDIFLDTTQTYRHMSLVSAQLLQGHLLQRYWYLVIIAPPTQMSLHMFAHTHTPFVICINNTEIITLSCLFVFLLMFVFVSQTLPALILKIMRGMFAPISDSYSDDLRQLILSMLHLDPKKRPMINQIMALPFVMNALMHLYTDFGKVPCRR